jgi:hypothetical protein
MVPPLLPGFAHDDADVLTFNPFLLAHWPAAVAAPSEWDGNERLSISFGNADRAGERRLLRAWCEALPEMRGLRWLGIASRVPQALFDAICAVDGLECLKIKHSSVVRLDAIPGATSLRYLRLGSSPKVESVAPLAALPRLRILELENLAKVSDFSALGGLRSLESLSVTGSMWSRQDVGALAPFAALTQLRALSLDTAKVRSLRPLATLTNLRRLGLGGRLPMQEYAWLSAHLPDAECQWFAPWVMSASFGPCRTCLSTPRVMLTGRGGGVVCRRCDAARLAKHEAAFALARAMAAVDAPTATRG